MGESHRLLKVPPQPHGAVDPATFFLGTQRDGSCRDSSSSNVCHSYLYSPPLLGQVETYLNCLPLFLSFLLSSVKLCLGLDCHCLGSTASADLPPSVNTTLPLTWSSCCRTRDSRDHAFGLESGRHFFFLLVVPYGAYRRLPAWLRSLH
jgi:hypothetical protein